MDQDDQLSSRSPTEVLHDHLALAAEGDWRADLERNVATHIVVLTGFGVFEGVDQVRVLAELLDAQLPNATFEYTTVVVRGEMGFLEWHADADGARVRDGADSFLICNGQIVAQTIHYTVETFEGDWSPRTAGVRSTTGPSRAPRGVPPRGLVARSVAATVPSARRAS